MQRAAQAQLKQAQKEAAIKAKAAEKSKHIDIEQVIPQTIVEKNTKPLETVTIDDDDAGPSSSQDKVSNKDLVEDNGEEDKKPFECKRRESCTSIIIEADTTTESNLEEKSVIEEKSISEEKSIREEISITEEKSITEENSVSEQKSDITETKTESISLFDKNKVSDTENLVTENPIFTENPISENLITENPITETKLFKAVTSNTSKYSLYISCFLNM